MDDSVIHNLTAAAFARFKRAPAYFVRTYGCQQNQSDSERIRGLMELCGFFEVADEQDADIILYNTCAVREHAEDRVFGNVGRLKKKKERQPDTIIALGGCMAQQRTVVDKLRESYPYVGVLFDTNNLAALPLQLLTYITSGRRALSMDDAAVIDESLPTKRDGGPRAWLPIMYGCDNFCSYCIVPYVRKRERSRREKDIIAEFRALVADGCRDITLLGQNVNSYRGETGGFPSLLATLAAIDGDFTLRFMTSHPKDATRELFDVIAANEKISRHFHLPVQSGSNRVLEAMNRRYTREQYIELVDYARSVVPDITFTSDIIVGFPGEAELDFLDTLSLVERVRYKDLFTFIYSKRAGTPAALLFDDCPHEAKVERLDRLTILQNGITREYESALVGRAVRGLPELTPRGNVAVRLGSNSVVETDSVSADMNGFCLVAVDSYEKNRLHGRIMDGD